jgi:hypothetical protein
MMKLLSVICAATCLSTAETSAASSTGGASSTDYQFRNRGSKYSGEERLRRLMRPHYRYRNPITQSVRDATGNPNISVIDRRYRYDETYTCTYFNLRSGQRVLKCG